jgi:hypothetical protein
MHRDLLLLLVAAAILASGCADWRMRSPQGLQWALDAEAQRRELTRQGFDQYGPSY